MALNQDPESNTSIKIAQRTFFFLLTILFAVTRVLGTAPESVYILSLASVCIQKNPITKKKFNRELKKLLCNDHAV